MKEYRFVGSHADELDGGQPVAPGDYTGPIDPEATKNASMIEDNLLLEVPDGTRARQDKEREAAERAAEREERAREKEAARASKNDDEGNGEA